MADENRWNDRDRDWRDDRSWEGRDRGRAGYYGAGGTSRGQGLYSGGSGGDFGPGGSGNRGYQTGGGDQGRERWREMHRDRRSEGPAGYNDSGPIQGGWEFGDEDQGRGQGYERYGYGRSGEERSFSSQNSGRQATDYGREGSGYGETYSQGREYGRGGGQYGQARGGSSRTDRWGYGESYGGAGYRGFSGGSRGAGGYGGSQGYGGYASESQTAYGAHTPYGYRGRNEYDDRGRGGEYADEGSRGGEERSWLQRAGDRVSEFFGAEDTGQHRGRGPKGYRRSDDRIRDDINDRLTDDAWLDASNIDVQVRDCEVTLTGTVNNREDKRRAEDLAEAISGVRHVQNNLRVEGGENRWNERGATTGTSTTTGMTTASASPSTGSTQTGGTQTASSAVQDVASGKDKGGSTGRQATT